MDSIAITDRQAAMVLNALPHLGPIAVQRLVAQFGEDGGALAAVLSQNPRALMNVEGIGEKSVDSIQNWRNLFDLDGEEEKLRASGARFLVPKDEAFPALLRKTTSVPIGLYALGTMAVHSPAVAIIGTRRPSLYGRGLARKLARELAQVGFCVVSGLARGIDSEAHEGALEVGGKTAAVLGCGLDIIYPPENLALYRKIAAAGVLLSEFPFGRRADRQTFPQRNRIVAGMCDAVIVVESGCSGGSMITARFAGEYGRPIFACPGRVDQDSARGCHQLIRDGATLLTCAAELIEELRYMQLDLDFGSSSMAFDQSVSQTLSDEESAIVTCLAEGAVLHPDELSRQTGIPPYAVSAALVMLELKRRVGKRADGAYESTFRN